MARETGPETPFDADYRRVPDLFGAEPERLLCEHWRALDAARPVLDIGCGQGRHALFLARQGITVEAIDPSRVAIAALSAAAARERLPLRATVTGFESYTPPAGAAPFAGILLFGVLQLLARDAIARLAARLAAWTAPGSLIFASAFACSDPSCARRAADGRTIGKHSFEDAAGGVRTYLEPDEVLDLFRGYGVRHHWEGMGPEHRHGDGPLERHALIEVVLERR